MSVYPNMNVLVHGDSISMNGCPLRAFGAADGRIGYLP